MPRQRDPLEELRCFRWSARRGTDRRALERVRETVPDVVVTDIKMPLMDGIAFLTQMKARWPDVEAIIISGYEEFGYARRAMSLGVKKLYFEAGGPCGAHFSSHGDCRTQGGSRQAGGEHGGRIPSPACSTASTRPSARESAMKRFSDLNGQYFAAVVLQHDNIRKAFEGHPQSPYNRLVEGCPGLLPEHAGFLLCGQEPAQHDLCRRFPR